MNNTNTTARKTAANTPFLARVKKENNHLIFKRASEIANSSGVEEAARYVATFLRPEYRDAAIKRLLA